MMTAKSENELDVVFLLVKQLFRNLLWLCYFYMEALQQ